MVRFLSVMIVVFWKRDSNSQYLSNCFSDFTSLVYGLTVWTRTSFDEEAELNFQVLSFQGVNRFDENWNSETAFRIKPNPWLAQDLKYSLVREQTMFDLHPACIYIHCLLADAGRRLQARALTRGKKNRVFTSRYY